MSEDISHLPTDELLNKLKEVQREANVAGSGTVNGTVGREEATEKVLLFSM